MKVIAVWRGMALLTLAVAAAAQAPGEVPVAKEPRHHFTFENQSIRTFRVEVAPHDRTLLHRHDRDYFYMAVGAADIINAVPGRPETSVHMANLQIGFAKGGFAHVAENRAETPFRNFTIEFKHPQSKLTNHCAKIDATQTANCPAALGEATGAIPEFATEDAIVTLLQVQPGATLPLDDSQHPRLLMPIGEIHASLLREKARPTALRAGKETWAAAGKGLAVRNTGKSLAQILSITLTK